MSQVKDARSPLLLLTLILGCGDVEPTFGSLQINTIYELSEDAANALPGTIVRALMPIDGRAERNMICNPSEWSIQSSTAAQKKAAFGVQLEVPQFQEWRLFLFFSPRSVEQLVGTVGPNGDEYFGMSNTLTLRDCGKGLNGSNCFFGSFSGGRILIDKNVGACP